MKLSLRGFTLCDGDSETRDARDVGWMDVAVKGSVAEREAFRAGLSAGDLVKFDAMRERMASDQAQSVSVSTTRTDGLTLSAAANLNRVPKLGDRCPSSKREMKLRSKPASKANFSCESSWDKRSCLNTKPKASGGCIAEGFFMPSMVGNIS